MVWRYPGLHLRLLVRRFSVLFSYMLWHTPLDPEILELTFCIWEHELWWLFNFHITNCPFPRSNIPSSPAYGVFIPLLIRYDRDCSSYECFILWSAQLSSKLFRQGTLENRLLWRSTSMLGTAFWWMTIYSNTFNWSDITPILTLLLNWTLLPN